MYDDNMEIVDTGTVDNSQETRKIKKYGKYSQYSIKSETQKVDIKD